MDKSHTPEDPYKGKLDSIFDKFTKKTTPAGQDRKIDADSQRKKIDDAVEKAGG